VDGTRWLRDTIASRGDPNPQLWITEVGATTCTGLKVCVDERKQARQIQDFIDIAAGWPYVRAVVIYSLRDNAGSAGDPAGRFGLLRRDLSPKPAWAAFQAALAH
jgi:hypothetical protein